MKRFSQLMPAGVPVEFDYPARSFTLLGCITPVDVRFGTGSQTQEVAEGMTPGLWYEAETPFRKVVITSPTDQVVSFLVSMGRSGLVKTPTSRTVILDLANTAAGATVSSPYVDLGDTWADATVAMIFSGVASAGQFMQIQCDGNEAPARPAVGRSWSGHAQSGSSASIVTISGAMPSDQLVRAWFLNGSVIQSASAYAMLIIHQP